MPNHVENDLRIAGAKKELLRFKEFAKDEDCLLSANKFIPYPEEFKKRDIFAKKQDSLRNLLIERLQKTGLAKEIAYKKAVERYPYVKDGFNSGGYEWCVKNWGTKWGMYEVTLAEEDYSDEGDGLFYTFQTAWSPPTPIIKKMSELFPTLEFDLRFFEQGAQFNGIFRIKNNRVLENKIGDYFGTRGG